MNPHKWQELVQKFSALRASIFWMRFDIPMFLKFPGNCDVFDECFKLIETWWLEINTLIKESSEVEEEYDYYDSMDSEDVPKETDYFFQARSIGFGSSTPRKSHKAAKKEKIGKNKHINFFTQAILAKVAFKY